MNVNNEELNEIQVHDIDVMLFNGVLEHIIGLDTQAKRNTVTAGAGVTVVEDLLEVDMESLLDCLTANTTVIAKTRLKTLKRWAEEELTSMV